MAKDEKRFVRVYTEGAFGNNEIWVDRQTGVNYLFHHDGYAGGLTVLLNRDGSPVVTSLPQSDDGMRQNPHF
ncbi:MAG: DUF6440 family protein [Firmicutes bacterium]|nr:DUF6440 family protein [Bacillota bacterium]